MKNSIFNLIADYHQNPYLYNEYMYSLVLNNISVGVHQTPIPQDLNASVYLITLTMDGVDCLTAKAIIK